MALFNLPSTLSNDPERVKRISVMWSSLSDEEKSSLWINAFENENNKLTRSRKNGRLQYFIKFSNLFADFLRACFPPSCTALARGYPALLSTLLNGSAKANYSASPLFTPYCSFALTHKFAGNRKNWFVPSKSI
jgi:hypothetical protein